MRHGDIGWGRCGRKKTHLAFATDAVRAIDPHILGHDLPLLGQLHVFLQLQRAWLVSPRSQCPVPGHSRWGSWKRWLSPPAISYQYERYVLDLESHLPWLQAESVSCSVIVQIGCLRPPVEEADREWK